MIMDGKWMGQYTYGGDYPGLVTGRSVLFEMNVTSSGIEFYGYFSDYETKNIFEDMGVVSGFTEGDFIYFEKQYPKDWQITEAGMVEIIENSFPPLIKYEGIFLNGQFEGNWEIHRYYQGDDERYSMIFGTGTWSMRKELLK